MGREGGIRESKGEEGRRDKGREGRRERREGGYIVCGSFPREKKINFYLEQHFAGFSSECAQISDHNYDLGE